MNDDDIPHPEGELNIREQIARIDQMLADHDRQEMRYAPWVLILPVVVGALTAGAALFAAGAAFMKLFNG
jgi:ABC-type Fe3+-siderophore transport system permease subunit